MLEDFGQQMFQKSTHGAKSNFPLLFLVIWCRFAVWCSTAACIISFHVTLLVRSKHNPPCKESIWDWDCVCRRSLRGGYFYGIGFILGLPQICLRLLGTDVYKGITALAYILFKQTHVGSWSSIHSTSEKGNFLHHKDWITCGSKRNLIEVVFAEKKLNDPGTVPNIPFLAKLNPPTPLPPFFSCGSAMLNLKDVDLEWSTFLKF